MTEPARPSEPAVALAVVVPAGPKDKDNVVDTVLSVLHFTAAPRRVVVVDDTGGPGATRALLEGLSDDVEVLTAPSGAGGGYGGLWVKIAAGYKRALDSGNWDVTLRLDADALVIGPGLGRLAKQRFDAEPQLGMLGAYRTGPDGGRRDWSPAARLLGRECGWRGLDRPAMRTALRRLRAIALDNGYVSGEHALGGAYLHSRRAIVSMAEKGWLDLPVLAGSHLGEDHIFALLTRAAGYTIGEFGGPGQPLAVQWRGLPAPPRQLLSEGKLVTHSVRSWDDMPEAAVRAEFAAARSQEVG